MHKRVIYICGCIYICIDLYTYNSIEGYLGVKITLDELHCSVLNTVSQLSMFLDEF